jgi:hypothetical protein
VSDQLGPGPHTRVRRLPEKAAYDEETVFAIIDAALMCHVAGVVDSLAMALPTLHHRVGRTLYVHGSRSNALLHAVLASGVASASVTIYDGLRLARSGFESSIAYRSVVIVGPTREVTDDEEKRRVLRDFVDAVLAGRASEVRELNEREAGLTLVVAIDIDEASAKVSCGPTDDDLEDAQLPIWAGTVPARLVYDTPIASTAGAMATGDIGLPDSVRRLLESVSATTVLAQQIRAIEPVDAREADSIVATLDRLTWPGNPYDERANDHHVTASAFVLSSRGVILHLHRRLHIWVQPGGHVDAGEGAEDAAVRETLEETGLEAVHTSPPTLFHVDVHPGPRGHTHYDLRYVLLARPLEPAPPAGESPEVHWFDFAHALERCEAPMVPALAKLQLASTQWRMRD